MILARKPVRRQQVLLPYERELLAGLPMLAAAQPVPTLPGLAATLGPQEPRHLF